MRGWDGAIARLTVDGFELFAPNADGILRWVETTRPTPPREAVVEHVRWLLREHRIADAEVRRLAAAGYRELAAAG
jgi:hypothetical protein